MATELIVKPIIVKGTDVFVVQEVLDFLDGNGLILTDNDLVRRGLYEMGWTPDTKLMAVPDELFCMTIRRRGSIQHCGVYRSKGKAERAFVSEMQKIEYFEPACLALTGEHEYDYKLLLRAIDNVSTWDVDFESIAPIE